MSCDSLPTARQIAGYMPLMRAVTAHQPTDDHDDHMIRSFVVWLLCASCWQRGNFQGVASPLELIRFKDSDWRSARLTLRIQPLCSIACNKAFSWFIRFSSMIMLYCATRLSPLCRVDIPFCLSRCPNSLPGSPHAFGPGPP